MKYRSPAEYYFKYLLSHPDNYTDSQIRTIVVEQDLIFVGMPYLQHLRQSMAIPLPFYPENLAHTRSRQFLERERIFSLHHPDEDVRAASAILEHPKLKVALEAMLITRVTPVYAAAMLRQREGFDVTARAIEHYQHYYFNIDLVGPEVTRAYMHRAVPVSETADPDEVAVNDAIFAAQKYDPRRLLSQMATPQIAQVLNSIRMGFMPSKIDVNRLAASARITALAMSQDAMLNRRSGDAQQYALVAKMTHEVLNDLGDGSGLQNDLLRLSLETEHTVVPSLGALPPPNALVVKGESVNELEPIKP